MTRVAFFLGGVLTGILGIAAAACISDYLENKRWQESMSAKSDLPAEAETVIEASNTDEADTDAMQTA